MSMIKMVLPFADNPTTVQYKDKDDDDEDFYDDKFVCSVKVRALAIDRGLIFLARHCRGELVGSRR